MSRLLWPFAVVLALFIGWWSAGLTSKTPKAREIERLTQQVTTLQARLRVAEETAAASPLAISMDPGGRSSARPSGADGGRTHSISAQEDRLVQESLARATDRAGRGQAQGDSAAAQSDAQAKAAP